MSQPAVQNGQGGLPAKVELERAISAALDEARTRGASAAEAAITAENGYSVTVRLGEVETVEHNRDNSMGITVYFGQRKGTASTTDTSSEAIRRTVEAACDIARHTAEDEYAGLADAGLMATAFPDLDMTHPWAVDAKAAIELAREAEAAALDYDKRINNSEGGSVSSHTGMRVYGNTHGFLNGYGSSYHSASVAVIAEDDGAMERDYWYSSARNATDLEAMASIGRHAAERTVSRLGARQLSTRKVPVLYAAETAASLLGHFTSAARGSSLYRKASFLLDRLGEPVFADDINIYEQPHLSGGLGSAPFDHEGVATAPRRELITNGVLQSYVLDSYSARRLGLQTTANAGGTHNLTIEPGTLDAQGLLRKMDTGLLVTELMGSSVNNITGDYSRGAAGFWVQGGEIQYPVAEITIAGNLNTMYRQMLEVGNDVDLRRSTRTGSILIEEMMIAGE
ncbi:metalloprotease PmbA [Sulfuriflexus mobilis]|uniref:metalloprotease PmbA n=1 Tax=Sulfuriflexus mobilis TaxID=1811807 RepID=UPI000F825403|nr:metalloprotease PmbA [Sulfuriflexus mobilis]